MIPASSLMVNISAERMAGLQITGILICFLINTLDGMDVMWTASRTYYMLYQPNRHPIRQTFFLYVYEPGGNRIKIATTTAQLITDPDYQTVV